jgi:DNA polymerase delta subunit 2
MLEDESGRLRLTGAFLSTQLLVTGCIIAVLGTENANGEFDVIDMAVPELPPQPERWGREDDAPTQQSGKLAILSGLGISGDAGDTLRTELLMEYLLGEAADPESQTSASHISRLLIAGNSISHGTPIPSREDMAAKKQGLKKYGYDPNAYNAVPTERFDDLLATILPSIPVTLLPGASDPANVSLPQQPLHPALFPHSRAYSTLPGNTADGPGWFDSTTNPWQGDVDGWRILGTGGQTVDDVFKYVGNEHRMDLIEAMLRWRLVAPTAPDTLCK